jgi:hypothetical protein
MPGRLSTTFRILETEVLKSAILLEHGTGQPFAAEHFGPVFKGQVGGEDQARAFVGAADDMFPPNAGFEGAARPLS